MWLHKNKMSELGVNLVSVVDGSFSYLVRCDNSHARSVYSLGKVIEDQADKDTDTEISQFWIGGDDIDKLNAAIDTKAIALSSIDNIYINISHFTNGRGLSLARQLRQTYKFDGLLWAVGDIIPDQYRNILACGFDGVKLPAKHEDISHWLNNVSQIDSAYQQPEYMESRNAETDRLTILQKRHTYEFDI